MIEATTDRIMPTDFMSDAVEEDTTLKVFPTRLNRETVFEAVTDIDRKRVFRMDSEILPTMEIEMFLPITRLPDRTMENAACKVLRITFVLVSEATLESEIDIDFDIARTMLATEAAEAERITERVFSLVIVARDEAEADILFPALLTNEVPVVATALIVLIIIFNGAIVATATMVDASDLLISFTMDGVPAIDTLRVLKNDFTNTPETTPIDTALKVFPTIRTMEADPEKVVLITRIIIFNAASTGAIEAEVERVL